MKIAHLYYFPRELSLGLLFCLYSIVHATPNAEYFSSERIYTQSELCGYDKILLQSVRSAIAVGQYQRVIEQTESLLQCRGGLALRTLIDIYNLRGLAYNGLIGEHELAQDGMQNNIMAELIVKSLNEYQQIYSVIKDSQELFISRELEMLESSWIPVVDKAYNLAVSAQDEGNAALAAEYYEILVKFLSVAQYSDVRVQKIRALSGVKSGYYYLQQNRFVKAQKYLSQSVLVDESFFNMDDLQLKANLPLGLSESSHLYYNLGGLIYQEVLESQAKLSQGDSKNDKKLRQLIKEQAKTASLYFRFSYLLDPNNVAAKVAADTLVGF